MRLGLVVVFFESDVCDYLRSNSPAVRTIVRHAPDLAGSQSLGFGVPLSHKKRVVRDNFPERCVRMRLDKVADLVDRVRVKLTRGAPESCVLFLKSVNKVPF